MFSEIFHFSLFSFRNKGGIKIRKTQPGKKVSINNEISDKKIHH